MHFGPAYLKSGGALTEMSLPWPFALPFLPQAVLRETGLLPHINAGVMGPEDILRLKKVRSWTMLTEKILALLQ